MGKARLLASVCALGLLVGAPAFAATAGDMGSGTPPASGGTAAQSTAPNATGDMHEHGAAGMNAAGMNATGMNDAGTAMHGDNAGMAGTNTPGTSENGHAMTGMSATGHGSSSGMHMGENRTHQWSHHAMRSRSRMTDTSQNAAVDRLNQQSLDAAKAGHSFQVGSADQGGGNMDHGGMNHAGMGSGAMSSGTGSMNGPGTTHHGGTMPGTAPSGGTSKM